VNLKELASCSERIASATSATDVQTRGTAASSSRPSPEGLGLGVVLGRRRTADVSAATILRCVVVNHVWS